MDGNLIGTCYLDEKRLVSFVIEVGTVRRCVGGVLSVVYEYKKERRTAD